jgi:hypothetical protein
MKVFFQFLHFDEEIITCLGKNVDLENRWCEKTLLKYMERISIEVFTRLITALWRPGVSPIKEQCLRHTYIITDVAKVRPAGQRFFADPVLNLNEKKCKLWT